MDQELNFKYTSLLNDPAFDQQLSDAGYAVFPLLGENEIKALSSYFFANEGTSPDHFYSSTHSKDLGFRKRSSDFIKNLVSPLLTQLLKDYRVLGGAFVVKPAKGKGALAPHQDWNIVDEDKHRSYNLWIPLVDVNTENGAVYVQAGSHRKIKNHRGPGINSPFKNIESLVWENLSPLPMKAGEALLYDHALIHGSPNNKTDFIRLGVVVGIIHELADMQLSFGNKTGIAVYKTTEDFFLEKDPSEGPQGLTLITEIKSIPAEMDENEYRQNFLSNKEKSWIKKLLWK